MLEYLIHIAPLGTFLATIVWCLVLVHGGMAQNVGPILEMVTEKYLLRSESEWKARQEARAAREGTLESRNCLEFVNGSGSCINLVPLETLHSLPKPGDVVLLPGHGFGGKDEFVPGAYLVETIEHIYTQWSHKGSRQQEARLTKAVAQVKSLNPTLAHEG